ncbi:MAG: SAM-dependent methyltransferase [Treponema sp.]
MPSNSYEKPDFWTKKAFSEGYPARSVYKLKEIDEKFHLIKKSSAILDLGAAPGSWTVFLLKTLDGGGKVVSCDLNPLAKSVKGENLTFIQGDLNDAEVRKRIGGFGPYDAVVCDAAPLTTGNRTVDTARSEQLAETALFYAETMLKNGGNFAVKLFQNGDQRKMLQKMKDVFQTAKGFKPKSCRTESFETYLIGIFRK